MMTLAQQKKLELQRQKLLVAKRKAEADKAKQREDNEKSQDAIRQERKKLGDIERKMREALAMPV